MSLYAIKFIILIISLILSCLYLFLNVKKEKNQGPTRKASFHRRKTWFFGFSIFLLTGIFVSEQYFVASILILWYLYIEHSYRKDLEQSVENLQEMNLSLQKQKSFLEEKKEESKPIKNDEKSNIGFLSPVKLINDEKDK